MWRINGEDIFQAITSFVGPRLGLWLGKEAMFMWSIWHKAVAIHEWRARIAPASISKQCPFCLPNISESIKHKFRDYIQVRRVWRWATFIIHDICGGSTGNYDSLLEASLG